MVQNVVNFSDNPTGDELMDDYLFNEQQNVLTTNSGIQRPSYAMSGTQWLDTSNSPWSLKMYNGTTDIEIGKFDNSNNKFINDDIVQNTNEINQLKTDVNVVKGNLSQTIDTSTTKYPSNKAVYDFVGDTLRYKHITNCITSIPQDINLELKDGTLTLKSGSKVYTGTGKAININSDIVFHSGTIGSSTDSFFIFCNTSGGFGTGATSSQCISNSSNPGSGYYVWFDTTNNKVMYSANANGTFDTELSLPIGIYQRTNGNATSIKQVFNGFGYVANTVFALPDVEGLIPNGRNSDGTLNNYTYKVNNVIIRTGGTTYTGRYTVVGNAGDVFLLSSGYTYNYELNINENNGVKSNSCIIGTVDVSAGKITTFNIKKVFNALDRFEFQEESNALSGTIDTINSSLSTKASVNADNFTSTGKQTVVGWGIPDYAYSITGSTTVGQVQYVERNSEVWVYITTSLNNSRMYYSIVPCLADGTELCGYVLSGSGGYEGSITGGSLRIKAGGYFKIKNWDNMRDSYVVIFPLVGG